MVFNKQMSLGLRGWVEGESTVKTALIVGLAELIGTAILVFLGCMGCIAGLGVVPPHLQITLTFGLAVMVVIQVSNHETLRSFHETSDHFLL